MKKEWLVKTFTLYVVVLFIVVSFQPVLADDNVKKSTMSVSNGNTFYVGGSGEGNYTRIQDAIDNASDGDTVFVFNDSSPYYENIIINKSISLIGEDKNTTIIDGNYIDYPIYMSSTIYVKINGFTFINPSPPYNYFDSVVIKIINCHNSIIENNIIIQNNLEYSDLNAGIYLLNSENNIINNNIIFNNRVGGDTRGIQIHDGAKFNNLSNNEIYNCSYGISIYSYDAHDAIDNTIYGNHIYYNYWGIEIIGGNNSKIINNKITLNRYDGIFIPSDNIYISGNIISNNGAGGTYDTGLEIRGDNTYIVNNQISNNDPIGIELDGANKNYIINNNITLNKQIGLYVFFSHDCIISKNNLIDNGNYNACFENDFIHSISNRWRNNYWSDNQGIIIHRIKGFIYLGGLIFFNFPWFNFDWRPAKEPYDINEKKNNIIDDYSRNIDNILLERFPLLQQSLDIWKGDIE